MRFIVRDGCVGLYLFVPLLPRLTAFDYGACSYQSYVSDFTPVSSCTKLKCS